MGPHAKTAAINLPEADGDIARASMAYSTFFFFFEHVRLEFHMSARSWPRGATDKISPINGQSSLGPNGAHVIPNVHLIT
jgi:hypothetical protein